MAIPPVLDTLAATLQRVDAEVKALVSQTNEWLLQKS
jgi:uncharacterized protein YoxC